MNAFDVLKLWAKEGKQWDVVMLDPPSFTKSRATINKADILVSWNFKHIVNFDKIKLFNSINMKLGYPLIDIRTPLEFLKDENDN